MRTRIENRDGCTLTTLAKTGVVHFQSCTHCGTVAMHLGAVTLRFDPAGLESLWTAMSDALMALHADRKVEESRPIERRPARGSA